MRQHSDNLMNGDDILWLVLRAQAGDREALEEILRRARGPLFGFLLNTIADRGRAEDVLQDVLFTIYRKLDWLREPECFKGWAFRIASRAAWRELARMRKLREEPLDHDPELPEPQAPSEELLDALPAHLEGLSPSSRAVLTLHYTQQLSLQDVAAVLGLPVGTVKSRLAYGLRCLRIAMKEES